MVVRKVDWPHHVVYTSAGKPASYQDISIPLFVQRYVIRMESEDSTIRQRMAAHLNVLVSAADLYRCDRTRAFHSVWLNQLEQGRCTRMDNEEKLRFCRVLVWLPGTPCTSGPITTRTSLRKEQCKGAYNASARPGIKACKAYNQGRCSKDITHAGLQHICAYCLLTVKWAFPHTEQQCNRKKGAESKNALGGSRRIEHTALPLWIQPCLSPQSMVGLAQMHP